MKHDVMCQNSFSQRVCVWWRQKPKEEDNHSQYDQKHEVTRQKKTNFDFIRLQGTCYSFFPIVF